MPAHKIRTFESKKLPNGTVTFLFTDIEGSTKLAQYIPDRWESLRSRHHAILRAAIESQHGYIFQTIGDAFCAAFHTSGDALQAALRSQIDLAAETWGESPVKVRMGIHTGKAELQEDGGYIGYLSLCRVQRLMSIGHGGQTLISQTTQDLVRDELPNGIRLRDLGEYRLKGLALPERIFQLLIPNIPADFPPLITLATISNNLPVQLTSFIGREKEIGEVKHLLNKERMVTITGTGGIGKTRLSLQTATEVLEDFNHGVWLVELAPLSDPTLVLQTVTDTLGVREQQSLPLQDTLIDYLREKNLLLILDNCEHLVDACALLVDALLHTCPGLKILASSREALGIAGEVPFHLASLSIPDTNLLSLSQMLLEFEAVRLFLERSATVSPSFTLSDENASAIAQVCKRLDGIPLAIELAAARTRVMSVEQILVRLDDRFRLLTGGSRTALPRQQTLHALVEWSHDLLSEPEQRVFRCLSVFAGGWTLEAAESVCAGRGISSNDILDLLTHLVDKSLVLAEPADGGTRFGMLETIRQYAHQKLQASGEEENLNHRHIDFYFQLVKESQKGLTGPDPSTWLKRLDSDKDNLYAALTWGIQEADGNGDVVQEMSGGLWMWWNMRGNLSEGRLWLEKTLNKSQKCTSPRAKALASFGIMAWSQGDIQEASRYLDESISILRGLEPPDLPGMAHVIHVHGHIALILGDFSTADKEFKESLKLYRELDDQYWVGTLISDLGIVSYHQGDYGSARDYQEQSLVIFQKYGNPEVTAQTLNRIGDIARIEGNYERAEECYETCLKTYQEIGVKLEIASDLHKLGYIAQHHGDLQKARSLNKESLSIQHESGNKQGIAECLAGLAGLAAVANQPTRSLRLFGAAQALLDACKAPLGLADQVEWNRDQAIARGQLAEANCIQAEVEGQAMEVEQAIEYALSENSSQSN